MADSTTLDHFRYRIRRDTQGVAQWFRGNWREKRWFRWLSSLIGAGYVAHAAPDGYTLVMIGDGTMAAPYLARENSFNPLTELAPISLAGYGTLLLATSPAFDFAPEVLPDHIRYVGPQLGEPSWAAPWTSPWAPDDARPLVLVSFSTTFQNQAALLQRVADALAGLPVRGLITLGGSIRRDELTAPANVHLADSAPHDALMREAALVVTHGGHGTVVRALTHRRPMLVFPQGRDQNDNAVRVTERGAGLRLPRDSSPEAIGDAIRRLLEEPDFTAAAHQLGQAIAGAEPPALLVEELEALVRRADPRVAAADRGTGRLSGQRSTPMASAI